MCCLLKGAGHAIYLLGKQKYCTNEWANVVYAHVSHTHTNPTWNQPFHAAG